MKRARIIYNPTSGRELFRKHLPEVLEKMEQAGYETSCHATTCEGDAIQAAKVAVERNFDLVIAVGGDGTLNEVISGIAKFEKRPKVGLIPMGTTNDFARAVHIPRDINKAVDIILKGDSIPVDIGLMNDDRYFINIAGGGRITELTYEVPSKLKTVLGQMAYYLKGIEMLPSIRSSRVKIEYDGQIFDDSAMMFLIGLTNSVGGFEKLAPDASINDGKFTLLILKELNMAEFIRVASLALRGEHLSDPHVIYAKASKITVTTEERVLLNLDGEYGGVLPAVFENLASHIEMYVPLDSLKEHDRK
ncbi:diacylglycerol kinase [Microbacterium sp. APC 3898]|uniref:Diacylglycerol kinase n=1 Tax=Planococcus notacanthi TaxID=3035188 RepID=A0ABT7ZPZ0_9BACL|nr:MULTISPECIES: diacylglycerol kinase [Terrabacteria group]MBF6633919.1 diacylglycerol kinase [Planococcus sp. (in: firmicutes)]MDN3428923.1 diacylglycerol kinase [Planococcus sp. APC 4016]MDN3439729.1 diacylglycerol kinase [Planococcus sp. APC 3900]MDN3500635.1 diacylglycerol kinase [Microbacterium sp. APC 3898]